jgi:hypothetical protein
MPAPMTEIEIQGKKIQSEFQEELEKLKKGMNNCYHFVLKKMGYADVGNGSLKIINANCIFSPSKAVAFKREYEEAEGARFRASKLIRSPNPFNHFKDDATETDVEDLFSDSLSASKKIAERFKDLCDRKLEKIREAIAKQKTGLAATINTSSREEQASSETVAENNAKQKTGLAATTINTSLNKEIPDENKIPFSLSFFNGVRFKKNAEKKKSLQPQNANLFGKNQSIGSATLKPSDMKKPLEL